MKQRRLGGPAWRQYRILDWPTVETEDDLGWPAGGDRGGFGHRGGFEVVGRRWDNTRFEVGRWWRQEDLGWPAGGGDRRLWVIGWSCVRTFCVTD